MVISDHLLHNTLVVHYFQSKLIKFLKKIMSLKIVIYISDGAASHYKNRKNFKNLANHEADFGDACKLALLCIFPWEGSL